jgi:hypothetical protein
MSSNDLEEITLNRSRLIRLIAIVVQPPIGFLLSHNIAGHEDIGDCPSAGFLRLPNEWLSHPSFKVELSGFSRCDLGARSMSSESNMKSFLLGEWSM